MTTEDTKQPPAKKKTKKARKKDAKALAKSKKKAIKPTKPTTKVIVQPPKPSTPVSLKPIQPHIPVAGLLMVTPSTPMTAIESMATSTSNSKSGITVNPSTTTEQSSLMNTDSPDILPKATEQDQTQSGKSKADPDTSLLNTNDSSDDEDKDEQPVDAGLSVQFQETTISSSTGSILPTGVPAPAHQQPTGEAMQGAETTPKQRKSTKFRQVEWYLMWDEILPAVTDALPQGLSAHQRMQQWIAMGLDFFVEHDFAFEIAPLEDGSPLRPMKRRSESFVDMCNPTVCAFDDFEEYFEI
jgi:hypothetical protein